MVGTANRVGESSTQKKHPEGKTNGATWETPTRGRDAEGFMDMWPYEVKEYTPEEIQVYVVESSYWSAYRLAMRGQPTPVKLDMLKTWREAHTTLGSPECILVEDAGETVSTSSPVVSREGEVQVDNYLNALVRRGFLTTDYRIVK